MSDAQTLPGTSYTSSHSKGKFLKPKPDGLSNLDHRDRIDALAMKLDALLLMTCGEQGETFRNLYDSAQDRILWTCSDMAGELCELLGLAFARAGDES